jgi:selenocysteine lyase/cysteine desulfurase
MQSIHKLKDIQHILSSFDHGFSDSIFNPFQKSRKSPKIKGNSYFVRLRRKEYGRFDKLGHVYLDYTGGNIYPLSLVKKHCEFLKNGVYGNPHSINPASLIAEHHITRARNAVLEFFNASDYYCIFTANASEALKIIGECYPFSSDSQLLLTSDNHNSVNGIREYCRLKGGSYTYSRMNFEDLSINEPELNLLLESYWDKKIKLFAYPAQSNVSGVQHSLAWIQKAHDYNWDVLLDAAAFVPTSRLNLSACNPDFVPVSFYKIFGYPTGVGCLLVRKSMLNKLIKPSFAGGTITLSAVIYSSYFLKPDHEKFENGTIDYLNIPAITGGLEYISRIGMESITSRIKDLSKMILSEMARLRHKNGRPLIRLYGPKSTENRGGTFLINYFDDQGRQYPLQFIEKLAIRENISCRTGCFCNPGIDELNHGISSDQLKGYFTSRDHGDYFDFINFIGKIRGAVRISIGFPTTTADIGRFINFSATLLNQKVPEEFLPSSAKAAFHSVNYHE